MSSDKDALEAQRLERKRFLLAFRQGGKRGSLLDQPRPALWILFGIGVVIVVVVATGITSIVTNSAPTGWKADGTLITDDQGNRYVIENGTVHAVANETTVRLIFGSSSTTPVKVSTDLIDNQPQGAPLGDPRTPIQPPPLTDNPRLLTCAQRGASTVLVDPAGAPPGASVVVASSAGRFLVTQRHAYALDARAASSLGLSGSDVTAVDWPWLDLVPKGPAFSVAQIKSGHATGPSWTKPGTLVTAKGSGRLYVASRAGLRPAANRTALELVYRGHVPRPVNVARRAIRSQHIGPALGSTKWPSDVPRVASVGRKGWACIDSDGAASVVGDLPTGGLSSTQEGSDDSLYTPRSSGALVAPPGKPDPASKKPVAYLLAEGLAYPVATEDALGSLGYSMSDAVRVPQPWIDALPAGPKLAAIQVTQSGS